VLTNRRT